MSVAHDHYQDLHRLIESLRPEQAEAVRSVVLQLVVDNTRATQPQVGSDPPKRRRLSFAGAINVEPDLATRSSEILREEPGDGQ